MNAHSAWFGHPATVPMGHAYGGSISGTTIHYPGSIMAPPLEHNLTMDVLKHVRAKEEALLKEYCSQPQHPWSHTMLHDLMTTDLSTLPLDTLFFLEAVTDLLPAKYAARGLDVPETLTKRQRAITRAIQDALEAQLDKELKEIDDLKAKETKRQDAEARAAKLRQALGQR